MHRHFRFHAGPLRRAASAPLLAMLLCAVASPLMAQRASTDGLAAALRNTSTKTVVRASVAHATIDGRLTHVAQDSLTITVSGAPRALAFAEIDSLWIREGSENSGAARGGLIGALALGGASALFTTSVCESPSGCTSAVLGLTLGGAVVGGILGLVIGASVGHVVPHWKQVHP